MARIVLHIGPEKCGSTSIQQIMSEPAKTHQFLLLDPYLIIGLDQAQPDPNAVDAVRKTIDACLMSEPEKVLIVSHEMIFKSRHMAANIAGICKTLVGEVLAVAYVRRQSDFAVSSFGQWHFRSSDRLKEARDMIANRGIDPFLFTGAERHLMAGLLGEWSIFRQPSRHLYVNWNQSVTSCAECLSKFGVTLSVGLLPRAGFAGDLVSDFRSRAGLEHVDASTDPHIRNRGFPPALIEATVNAIEAGLDMPGPHEANGFFAGLDTQGLPPLDAETLQPQLQSFVDTAFLEDNRLFAQRYDHPINYFLPTTDVTGLAAEAVIHAEAQSRMNQSNRNRNAEASARAQWVHQNWIAYRAKRVSA